jgi:hypothetical protein
VYEEWFVVHGSSWILCPLQIQTLKETTRVPDKHVVMSFLESPSQFDIETL